MPAVTFVDSEHSLLQGHAEGRDSSSPWKSTRQRISEDDHRSSLHGMGDGEDAMDGSALYERSDWPLSPTRMPPEQNFASAQEESSSTAARNAHIHPEFQDQDTSSKSMEENQQGPTRSNEDVWDAGFEMVEHNHATSIPSSQHSDDEHLEGGLWHSALHVARSGTLDVSPITEDIDPMKRDISPVGDEVQSSPVLPSQSSPISRPGNRDGINVTREGRISDEEDTVVTARQLVSVSGHEENHSRWSGEDMDFATTRPHPSASPSAQDRQHVRDPAMSRTSSVAQRNGAGLPPSNGNHMRNSSNSHTSLSRRGSQKYQTMEISHNKDRVRYSWQSVQDDGPNRPRIHIIKLVSNTVTASAGFPQGEAFGFSMSPSANRIAAFNSARLYVLQTSALPTGISQDYSLKRRPLAVELVDDGDILAILADEHTINVYDIGCQQPRRTKTIKLDYSANCIALAPTGGLLAAAYEGGVEIFSLDPRALPTDRRAVRCQRMDRLTFSADGSTLLGTTTRINNSSTAIVSVPIFPESPSGVATHEELKEAWCTGLLHPESVRNSSHAIFFRENGNAVNDRLFAWNGLADTFGVLSVADLHYGNVDFPVVISPPLSACGGLGAAIHSCPTIDRHGDTVAMIVNDRTIRLYIIPHDADEETTVEAHSIDHELDEGYGCPFSDARWVLDSTSLPTNHSNQTRVRGRLVVTSPGGVLEPGLAPEEMVEDIERGRIILFDFDPEFAGQPGQTFDLILGKTQPQLLEEAEFDVAHEVALIRSRTINQLKNASLNQRPISLGRTASKFRNDRDLRSPSPGQQNHDIPAQQNLDGRRSMLSSASVQSEAARSLPDLLETSESPDQVVDEPYAQNAPRSHDSLQRAASNVQRHRYQTLEERNREHISPDSNGQFLALPEYTEEPNAPLPSRFRAMAGLDKPSGAPSFTKSSSVVNANAAPSQGNAAASTTPLTSSPAIMEHPESPLAPDPEVAAGGDLPSTPVTRPQQVSRIPVAMRQQSPAAIAANSRAVQSPGPAVAHLGESARNNTHDSPAPLQRILRRAQSNAVIDSRSTKVPSLIGDWDIVSPIHRPLAPSRSENCLNASIVPEDEAYDLISPVHGDRSNSNYRSASHSASQAIDQHPYRYSTSLLDPPGHVSNVQRAPSSASSLTARRAVESDDSASTHLPGVRRCPPHMQAFREAAAAHARLGPLADTAQASAAASLFPNAKPADHVPHRNPPTRPGGVAHSVMAWHTPAPSSSPEVGAKSNGRKSGSLKEVPATGLSPPEKAQRMGLFRNGRKKKRPFEVPGGYSQQHRQGEKRWEHEDGGSRMETKSAITWMMRDNGKCAVM
nr:hypothetical protein CFP56_70594 [Quercus suber]